MFAVPKLTHFPCKNESNLELPQRTSIAILYGDCDWIFGLYALPVRNARTWRILLISGVKDGEDRAVKTFLAQ